MIIISKLEKEYQRIKGLFEDADEKQLKLLDGVILEAARIKVELDEQHSIVQKVGKVAIHPKDPRKQKILPIANQLTKDRASYSSYMSTLSKLLGVNIEDEDDEDMREYE